MDSALKILLGIIAKSKTIPQLTEALNIYAEDYITVYSSLLQQPVKIKKSNILFPTDSFFRGANLASFPASGLIEQLYLADDTNKLYKWDLDLVAYVWLEENELETYLQLAKDYADSLLVGGGDKNFIHDQGVPAISWNITHSLNKFPSVQVLDSAKTVVEGQIIHFDANNLQITFNSAFSGTATLN
jgi:hypothetical protein